METTECQYHNNCGGYCETSEEIEQTLCEDCLQSEREQYADAAELARLKIENVAMRDLLMWALWHHQGASSPVGQPIRVALGIGPHDALTVAQVHAASDVVGRLMRHNVMYTAVHCGITWRNESENLA